MGEFVQLIPALPDDAATECLVRVPYQDFAVAGAVCRRWKELLESDYFHELRKSSRKRHTIVAFLQAVLHPSPELPTKSPPAYQLSLYEPKTEAWTSLPPIPGFQRGAPLFCQLAAVGWRLVVIGGWEPETFSVSNGVYIYDFLKSTWRRGSPMPGPPRSFFAAAAVEELELVVVAGGHDDNKAALKSAMVYDLRNDEWAVIPDMAVDRDESRAVFMHGRVHVLGGYPTEAQGQFCKSAESVDPATWTWGPAKDVLPDATAPRAVAVGPGGRMYTCLGRSLVVYDGDTWRQIGTLPDEMRGASHVVWYDGDEMMVLGPSIHDGANQVAFVMEMGKSRWKKVERPPEFAGHVQAWCILHV